VDTNNPAYSSLDGVLFDKNQTTLIECPGGKTGKYTIPNSVTSVANYAFFSCTSLTDVTIPNGVTAIGAYAFDYCTSLGKVTVPGSVLSIGFDAFIACSSLTAVYFQGNTPNVNSNAFYGQTATTLYYLPGTTGWDQWVAPPPAVLWNPSIQTADGNFGVQGNQFGFTINGTTGIPIAVVACTDPANPTWLPLQTCTLTNGSIYFSDPDWTNYPARIYRIRSP
jgi:hypothetical protein